MQIVSEHHTCDDVKPTEFQKVYKLHTCLLQHDLRVAMKTLFILNGVSYIWMHVRSALPIMEYSHNALRRFGDNSSTYTRQSHNMTRHRLLLNNIYSTEIRYVKLLNCKFCVTPAQNISKFIDPTKLVVNFMYIHKERLQQPHLF